MLGRRVRKNFADEVLKGRLACLRVSEFCGKTAYEGGLFNVRPKFGDTIGWGKVGGRAAHYEMVG